jgi:hypothetical protein
MSWREGVSNDVRTYMLDDGEHGRQTGRESSSPRSLSARRLEEHRSTKKPVIKELDVLAKTCRQSREDRSRRGIEGGVRFEVDIAEWRKSAPRFDRASVVRSLSDDGMLGSSPA